MTWRKHSRRIIFLCIPWHQGLWKRRWRQNISQAQIDSQIEVLNRDFSESSIRAVSGQATVPQVFINGEHVGGSEALEQWLEGRLDAAA